ncbi:MAG: hypothetical protein Roseis2KO_60220 [Roseivirga sp.]
MSHKKKRPASNTIAIKLIVPVEEIQNFHLHSQENPNWANIYTPFPADNFVGGLEQARYLELFPEQTLTFEIANADEFAAAELEIEYVRLRPLGEIHYKLQSPRAVWANVIDVDQTKGAVGRLGAYYLKRSHENPPFKLITSSEMTDYSPNLAYSILFSFKDNWGTRRYCTVDPLIKTSSVHTPPSPQQ